MKTIKVGIIGAGFIGRQHIEAIRRIPGAVVTALVDTNPEQGKRLCEELAIPGCYQDYMEMIEKEQLDVVHNCTPNHLHYEICRKLMEKGIHVYCEKPLANTSEESGELCRLAREKGILAGVNFNYRQNAIVREMHERINGQENDWGQTFLIRGHYLQDWMMYDTDYNWRCIPELNGPSRTIADIGSHLFDTVQYITGHRIVRVFADIQTVLKKRKKSIVDRKTFETRTADGYELVDIDSEDFALILVEFDNGIRGQLTLSQITGGHKNDLCVAVDGSRYSMMWEQEKPDKLQIGSREEGNITRYAGPEMLRGDAVHYGALPSGHALGWTDAFKNGIQEFYRTIRDGSDTNYATFEDADYIVRIVVACLKSAEEKRWTEV